MSEKTLPLFPDGEPLPTNYRNIKGTSLERAFGTWLKSQGEYDTVKYNQPLSGKTAQRAYEVDVVGSFEKYDSTKVNTYIAATTAGIIALFYFVFEIKESLGLVALGALAMYLASQHFNKIVYVWVECKNQQGTVKRRQMQLFLSNVEDVRANDNAAWKPDNLMYVAFGGYDADALHFAAEHGVDCYVSKANGKGFELVDY